MFFSEDEQPSKKKLRPVAPAERIVKLARVRGTEVLVKAWVGDLSEPVGPTSRRGCRRS